MKLSILRGAWVGPATDFSVSQMAFAFIANGFEFPGKKVVRFAGPLDWPRDRFFSFPNAVCVHRKRF